MKQFWTEGFGSILIAIGVALTIRWAFLEAYVIPSASMMPTLLIHDHIFVNKMVYGVRVPFSENWLVRFADPKRGEIIVFKYPLDKNTFFIKRVVGLPGDTIRYENRTIFVNDVPIEQGEATDSFGWDMVKEDDFATGDGIARGFSDSKDNYVHLQEKLGDYTHSILLRKDSLGGPAGPWKVPEGHLFMMGDNRDNSADSRRWQFLPVENILGRATFVWLSCEDTVPKLSFLCNPLTIRWSRLFHGVH
jgi:signal peptidase I